MEFDATGVVAEVSVAFHDYERALIAEDHARLDHWFWADERVVRFGISDIEYGFIAVAQWRRSSPFVGAERTLSNTVVTALGRDAAIVSTEFSPPDAALVGRQTQVWARLAEGWRIVHAHVSTVAGASLQRSRQHAP